MHTYRVWEIPTTFCDCTRDNRWFSQKLSMEKSTIGNEPLCMLKVTVFDSFSMRYILIYCKYKFFVI